MSREKPKKIKVSVGSRIFDTVNLIFLILLGLTTFYPFWDCLVVSFSSLKAIWRRTSIYGRTNGRLKAMPIC